MSEVDRLRLEAEAVLRRIDLLDSRALLYVHREVCRRAAAIYEPLYRATRVAHYNAWRAASGRAPLEKATATPPTHTGHTDQHDAAQAPCNTPTRPAQHLEPPPTLDNTSRM